MGYFEVLGDDVFVMLTECCDLSTTSRKPRGIGRVNSFDFDDVLMSARPRDGTKQGNIVSRMTCGGAG
jgi:hypothetical protein